MHLTYQAHFFSLPFFINSLFFALCVTQRKKDVMGRGVLAVLLLLLTAAVQKASAQRTYVGCFTDTLRYEMLSSTTNWSGTPISLDNCEAYCGPNGLSSEGYTMMGLLSYTSKAATAYSCSCGWTSGRNTQDDSKCRVCGSGTTDRCGDPDYIVVYRLVPEATMFAKTAVYYSGDVTGETHDYSNCMEPSSATWCNCPNNNGITGLYRDSTQGVLSAITHFRCMGPEDEKVNMEDDFRYVNTVWKENTWIECPDNNVLRGFISGSCDTIDCISGLRCQTAVLNGVTMARSDVFYMDTRDCMVDGDTAHCDLPTNAFLVGMFRSNCDTLSCITHMKYAFFDGVVTLAPTEPPATDAPATDPPATDPPTEAPETALPSTLTPGNTQPPPTPAPDTAIPETLPPQTPAPDTAVPSTLTPGHTRPPATPAPKTATPTTAPTTTPLQTAPPDTPAPTLTTLTPQPLLSQPDDGSAVLEEYTEWTTTATASGVTGGALATTVVTGGSFTMTSHGLSRVARAQMYLRMLECPRNTATPMPFVLSPSQLRIGRDTLREERGAAVGNTVIITMLILTTCLGALVHSSVYGTPGVLASLREMPVPVVCLVLELLWTPIMQGATALVLHGSHADLGVGIGILLLSAGVIAWLLWLANRARKTYVTAAVPPTRWLDRYVAARWEWREQTPTHALRASACVFDGYRFEHSEYFAIPPRLHGHHRRSLWVEPTDACELCRPGGADYLHAADLDCHCAERQAVLTVGGELGGGVAWAA